MLFSSITFLYYFLPAVFVLYAIAPKRLKNLVLLLTSLVFYAWGEPVYVLLMIFSVASNWALGFLIDKHRGTPKAKAALTVSVVISLGLLGLFKYSDFFIENLNHLLAPGAAPGQYPVPLLGLALPIGISFYTFQILSYTIDLYRGDAKLQRNILNLATYVALFPQLIAGPIVRYTTVAQELESRRHSLEDFSAGATRFVIGLGKKVLLANVMAELTQLYKDGIENSVLFAWLYVVAYSFHVYFDFSGYSDMAIGLGRIFGFKFLENFNYPFISQSITEFWRRWHMSLGTWFRDYVYIPLGGNRVKPVRQILNIFAVWFLTGFWHGAGWNFIAWGLYFGVLLMLEKFVFAKVMSRLPRVARHAITMMLIFVSWILFDSASLGAALGRIGHLFGIGVDSAGGVWSMYYLRSYAVPLLVGLVGATPLPKLAAQRLAAGKTGGKVVAVLRPVLVAALLVACTAYLIDGSFNPFIYFRF